MTVEHVHRFALLSACKNESSVIRHTLESVIAQTEKPVEWVIVDDGSTDGTPEIIESYLGDLPFLTLIRLDAGRPRCFGSKDRAIEMGYKEIAEKEFDFVGVFDTDIGLPSKDYFREVMAAFDASPKLGIAGGVICEKEDGVFKERKINVPWSVAGCVQMFRRECYDKIGGFVPLQYGGSDTFAELQVRMNGWETRSIQGLEVYHYRPTSSAGGVLKGCFRAGMLAGSFGSHPLFMLVKCARRLSHQPFIVGACAFWFGYVSYSLRGKERLIPDEVVKHLRNEQKGRLRALVGGSSNHGPISVPPVDSRA
ncbi:glycosyltransferase [Haloferula sp.]|uniref:glycosyltransferase n=1 Tax=Haloferula sp. TaxID=2497595 RepID=UPI00329CCEE8